MIYGIIIFVLTLAIDLWTDYRLWLKYRNVNRPQGSVDHVTGAILRLLALALCMVLMGWWSIPMILFVYWVLMDGFFNLLTRQSWFRIGTTAKLDVLQRKYPALVWMKYVLAILSIILFIWKQ